VLVADDDSSILDLFQQVLSRVETGRTVHLETGESESKFFQKNASNQSLQCFDVVTCQQGDEAVDAVKSAIKEDRPFSVAFIDIRMPPGPDGIWTAEHIRAFDPDIEIVIFTGYSDTHPRDIARRVPPVHKLLYLQKPFHSQEIYQFASALSMKWHTECELQRVNKELEKFVEARTQELKESEGRFKNFLDNLCDIAYETDSYGNVTYANKTGEIITGTPLKDIIGKPFLPLYAEESQAIAMDVYQKTLKGESPQFDLTFTNGRICYYKNEPLKDKEGQVIGVFGIARDITYLKRAEEALRESEKNFRTLAENANDGILIAAGEGKNVFANKRLAEITGYSISELLKAAIKDLTHPDDFKKIKKRFETIISGKPFRRHYKGRMIRKNGKEIQIEVSSARSQWKGQPVDIAIFRDLTKRVKAEEALKKAHNGLDRLVKERTLKLNNALKDIHRSEKELTQRKFALEKLNIELMETNQALSILARNIDRDKELLEKKIYEITSTNIMPIIKGLQDDKSCQNRLADLELLKTYLNGLISGPTDQHEIVACLSSQEMRVAVMIKRGLTSPKIAAMLNVSLHTVKTHRKNIRKKLKLQNSNVNLCSYLRSKMVSDSM